MKPGIAHGISASESRDSSNQSKMDRSQSPSQLSLSPSPSPSPATLPSSTSPSPSSQASPGESTANSRCNSFSIDYILSKSVAATTDTTMTARPTTAGQSTSIRKTNNPVETQDESFSSAKSAASNQQKSSLDALAASTTQVSNPNFLYFMACMLLQQQQQQQTQACQQQLTQRAASSRSPPIEQQTSKPQTGPIDSLALLARLTGGFGDGGSANCNFKGANQPMSISSTHLQNLPNFEQPHQSGVSVPHSFRRQSYQTATAQRSPRTQNHQHANLSANMPHAFMPDQLRRQPALMNSQMTLPLPNLAPSLPLAPSMVNQFASMMTSMQQALGSMATNRAVTNPLATPPTGLQNQFDEAEQSRRNKHHHQLLLLHLRQQQQQQQQQLQQQQQQQHRSDCQKIDYYQHKGMRHPSSHQHPTDCSQPKRSKTLQHPSIVQTGSNMSQQQAQQPMNRVKPTEASGKQLDTMKPAHSYIGLIAMCILSTPEKRMVLNDIYQFILDHYPYYRNRGSGWRNSVRHNLSLNECFQKDIRAPNGKGHYWCIHPANMADFMNGDFRRRRAQRQVRRHNNMEVPSDESDDESMDADRPPLPEHFKRSLEMHRQLELIYGKQPPQEVQQQQQQQQPRPQVQAQHRSLGLTSNGLMLANGATNIATGGRASTSPAKLVAGSQQHFEAGSCLNGPAASHLVASPSTLQASHHI